MGGTATTVTPTRSKRSRYASSSSGCDSLTDAIIRSWSLRTGSCSRISCSNGAQLMLGFRRAAAYLLGSNFPSVWKSGAEMRTLGGAAWRVRTTSLSWAGSPSVFAGWSSRRGLIRDRQAWASIIRDSWSLGSPFARWRYAWRRSFTAFWYPARVIREPLTVPRAPEALARMLESMPAPNRKMKPPTKVKTVTTTRTHQMALVRLLPIRRYLSIAEPRDLDSHDRKDRAVYQPETRRTIDRAPIAGRSGLCYL